MQIEWTSWIQSALNCSILVLRQNKIFDKNLAFYRSIIYDWYIYKYVHRSLSLLGLNKSQETDTTTFGTSRKKGPRPKHKQDSDKNKKCLSVSNSGILSVCLSVCLSSSVFSVSTAYSSLCRGLKYSNIKFPSVHLSSVVCPLRFSIVTLQSMDGFLKLECYMKGIFMSIKCFKI